MPLEAIHFMFSLGSSPTFLFLNTDYYIGATFIERKVSCMFLLHAMQKSKSVYFLLVRYCYAFSSAPLSNLLFLIQAVILSEVLIHILYVKRPIKFIW